MLKDKVAFITGASRGIGRATAEVFAREGAILILNGRDEARLTAFKEELVTKYSSQVYVAPYDVTDTNAIKQTFQQIKKQFGKLDVLVNNAGILDDALLGMISEQSVKQTFSVNIESMIYHMQLASRLMVRQKGGSIINVSSIIGRTGNAGQVVYGASKSAVIGATYSAAKELGSHAIRVNAVAPGFIDTDMTKQISTEKYNKRLSEITMQRIGQPEEVANTILFLASDLSSYVTGQVLGVDGGMII